MTDTNKEQFMFTMDKKKYSDGNFDEHITRNAGIEPAEYAAHLKKEYFSKVNDLRWFITASFRFEHQKMIADAINDLEKGNLAALDFLKHASRLIEEAKYGTTSREEFVKNIQEVEFAVNSCRRAELALGGQ